MSTGGELNKVFQRLANTYDANFNTSLAVMIFGTTLGAASRVGMPKELIEETFSSIEHGINEIVEEFGGKNKIRIFVA